MNRFAPPPRIFPLGLAVAACLLSPTAFGFDADGDGIADEADAYPCDIQAAAAAYMPAQGTHGMLLFEDQWPDNGDNDFNDVGLTYNYVFRLNAAGQALSVRATFNTLALGGTFDNGLGMVLPVSASAVASVTRTVGSGSATPLTPSANDAELTVQLSQNLREFFGGQRGQINSLPGVSGQLGQTMVIDIAFASPQTIAMGETPFDIYIFDSGNPGREIHRAMYSGTAQMDATLFGTRNDGSTSNRRFVNNAGLPFAIDLSDVTRAWPQEAVAISTLFPRIVNFAASGGSADQDFYASLVVNSAAWTASSGTPVPSFVGNDHFSARTQCIAAWGQAVTFGSSRNSFTYDTAIAANGDLVVVGYVRGAYPGFTNQGGLDIFVARYDAQTGAEQWLLQMGGAGDDTARGITIDSTGNIYVVGESQSNLSGETNLGGTDAFMTKIDSSGVTQWVRLLGGAGEDAAYDVAVSPFGDIFMVGGSTSAMLGGAPAPGARSAFLASFDAQGSLLSQLPFTPDVGGSNQDAYATAVATHPITGEIYVAGVERRYSQSGAAVESQFLTRFDIGSMPIWSQHIGGYGYNAGGSDHRFAYAADVSIDAVRGAVYVAGRWHGGSAVTQWGVWSRSVQDTSADATITALGAVDGAQLWSYVVASTDAKDEFSGAVQADPATGIVYLTGRTSGTLPGQSSKGGDDYFVAAWQADGTPVFVLQDGTSAQDVGTGVDVNGSNLLVTSNTTGALLGPNDGLWDIALQLHDATTGGLQSVVQASHLGWTTGAFSACDTTCGTGTQARNVTCVRADGTPVADTSCIDVMPVRSQSCSNISTCSYGWSNSAFGSCSNSCGNGTQSRTVSCLRSDGATVADTFCTGTRPATAQSCNNTSACTYSYFSSAYSACSGLCGTGTQSRTVYCERSDGAEVSSSFCSGGAPATSQSCALTACSYSYQTSAFSACNVSCGTGIQTRTVQCIRGNDGQAVSNSLCAGGTPASSQSCNAGSCTGSSCQALYANGERTNGVYSLAPSGSTFSGWCEMGVDGGGWTLAMTLNTQDGNISRFVHNIWTDRNYGTIGNRWRDFKSQASTDMTGSQLLLIVRVATTNDGGNIIGYRSWNLSSPRTFQSFFDGSIGQSSENNTGSCNNGYSGGGRRQTSGISNSGSCASYNGYLDTFTCRATQVYTNSYYSNCGSNQEAFRMSSYFRWANNSQVGLGLQMDYSATSYDLEAGNHMDWESNRNPQRHGQPAAIGSDFYTPNQAQGQAWRFEWYIR